MNLLTVTFLMHLALMPAFMTHHTGAALTTEWTSPFAPCSILPEYVLRQLNYRVWDKRVLIFLFFLSQDTSPFPSTFWSL